MSAVGLRSYFRTRLDGLGLSEWRDGFNYENIPAANIHKAYHMIIDEENGRPVVQQVLTKDIPIMVNVFWKGYRDPQDGIDSALDLGENVIHDVMATANRLGDSTFKNLQFIRMKPFPYGESNDNIIRVEIVFSAMSICAV